MNIITMWPPVAAIQTQLINLIQTNLDIVEFYDKDDLILYMAVNDEIDVDIEDESNNQDTIDAFSISKSDQEGSFVHTALCKTDGTVVSIAVDNETIALNDYLEQYA